VTGKGFVPNHTIFFGSDELLEEGNRVHKTEEKAKRFKMEENLMFFKIVHLVKSTTTTFTKKITIDRQS